MLFLVCSRGGTLLFAQQIPMKISISLAPTNAKKFTEFLKDKTLINITNFRSPFLDSNEVLESIIAAKAIALGGIHPDFEIIEIPNSAREREVVKSGFAVISGTAQWDFYIKKFESNCYFTDVVIMSGFFEKGIYTTSDNAKSISIKSSQDLSRYSFVINKNWVVDWETLESLHPKKLFDAPTRESMFAMVTNGRTDCTLQTFSSNADLSIQESGIRLFPVYGVKVALYGNRHFMVSKNNQNGKKVFESLERGLAIMKKNGELTRILRESGIYNSATKNWVILNSNSTAK
jgi:hypothetical protein